MIQLSQLKLRNQPVSALGRWFLDRSVERGRFKEYCDCSTSAQPGEKFETTGWSSFLKSHTRGDSGAYAKTSGGRHIDMPSGGSVYFGTIGSQQAISQVTGKNIFRAD